MYASPQSGGREANAQRENSPCSKRQVWFAPPHFFQSVTGVPGFEFPWPLRSRQ